MNKNDRMTMMAELPVHTVLLKMSIPMMISFFIQAMYNIVDSMFVARISESALTAVPVVYGGVYYAGFVRHGGILAVSDKCGRHRPHGHDLP